MSGAGDVNGDGFDDLIVGAPHDFNRGSARVFSGCDGSVLYSFEGDSTNDNFGTSVSGAGDVNADGFDDLTTTMALVVVAFGYSPDLTVASCTSSMVIHERTCLASQLVALGMSTVMGSLTSLLARIMVGPTCQGTPECLSAAHPS